MTMYTFLSALPSTGGVVYTTSLTTLMKYPESMLGRMFGGPIPTAQDGGGSFFIDRDGKLFRFILNFLRNDKLTLPENFAEVEQLREEADFYQIQPMFKAIVEYEATRNQMRERAEEGLLLLLPGIESGNILG